MHAVSRCQQQTRSGAATTGTYSALDALTYNILMVLARDQMDAINAIRISSFTLLCYLHECQTVNFAISSAGELWEYSEIIYNHITRQAFRAEAFDLQQGWACGVSKTMKTIRRASRPEPVTTT